MLPQDFIDMEGEVYCVEEDFRQRVGDMKVMDGIKLVSWTEARDIAKKHQLVNTF
jgi:sulfur transfer complex TusBCD TusB component (DsrH family)